MLSRQYTYSRREVSVAESGNAKRLQISRNNSYYSPGFDDSPLQMTPLRMYQLTLNVATVLTRLSRGWNMSLFMMLRCLQYEISLFEQSSIWYPTNPV